MNGYSRRSFPYKKPHKLPTILSPDEVLQFLAAMPNIKQDDPDDMLRSWFAHL